MVHLSRSRLRGHGWFVVGSLLVAAASAGCLNAGAELGVSAGIDLQLDPNDVPAALRDGDHLRSLACSQAAPCPSAPGLAVSCTGGACDPGPIEVVVPTGPIDVDSQLSGQGSSLIKGISIDEARFRVDANTLTVDLPPSEVWWGPPSATGPSEAQGAHLLARLPAIPAGVQLAGDATLVPAGNMALEAYLAEPPRNLQLFVRGAVDVDPGDPVPAGRLEVSLELRVHVSVGLR
ncbi:MAG: hypothetical protein KC543_00160 [Myxococcales bacterium]|nr:hypothetical protein [Myxococcales bacterium]